MSDVNEDNKQSAKSQEDLVNENYWMIRDCDDYIDEYDECTSVRGRFHQYFIYGETLDCNQWKRDYTNCCKYRDKHDLKAAESVIDSEKARRSIRLKAHFKNTTWKKRNEPPADWAKPLPEWISKRDENSYLSFKANQINKEINTEDEKNPSCVIM